MMADDHGHVWTALEDRPSTPAVTALMPSLYQADANLLIEGLQLAAMQQQAEARKTILAGVAIGGVVALAIGSTGK
jgi:hypothetical protein